MHASKRSRGSYIGPAADPWVKWWGYFFRAIGRGVDSIEKVFGELSDVFENPADPQKRQRAAAKLANVDWTQHYERPAPLLGLAAANILPLRDLLPILNPRQWFTLLRDMHDGTMRESSYDPPLSALPKITAFAYAARAQLRSYLLYQRSMSALIAQGRQGIDEAFIDAVRVDPAAIACTPVQQRLRVAIALGEQEFLLGIRDAFANGNPAEREYSRLDFALAFLVWTKQIDKLTQQRAAALFIDEARLYRSSGKDPARSLWRFIQRWKSEHATLITERMSS